MNLEIPADKTLCQFLLEYVPAGLGAMLAQLAQKPSPPAIEIVLFLPAAEPETRDALIDAVLHYKFCLAQRGYYRQLRQAPVSWQICHPHQVECLPSLLPAQAVRYALCRSPAVAEPAWQNCLRQDPAVVFLSQSQIEPATPGQFGLSQALASARQLAEAWLQEADSAWDVLWQGPLGDSYRFVQDLQLWKFGLLSQDQDFLHQVIQSCLTLPPGSALLNREALLLLYKRMLRPSEERQVSDSFNEMFRTYRESMGRCLEILPPVRNFRVTILLLTFNRLETLQRAVNSVLNQTYTDWKLLIGDDASSDGITEPYCRQLAAQDPRIEYIRHPQNVGHARNFDALADAAETELIVGLADDDYLSADYVASAVRLFQRMPWLGVVIVPCKYVNQTGQVVNQFGPFYPVSRLADPELELQRAAAMGAIYLCGFLYRKPVLQEMAPFDLFPKTSPQAQPKYAMADCAIAGYCLSHYEVGLVHDAFLHFSVWAGNASAQRDTTPEHLAFFEMLFDAHQALLGPQAFPAELADYVFNKHVMDYVLINNFRICLTADSVPEFLTRLQLRQPIWQDYVRLRTRLLPQANSSVRPRLTAATARGRNIWGGHYTRLDRIRRLLSPLKHQLLRVLRRSDA